MPTEWSDRMRRPSGPELGDFEDRLERELRARVRPRRRLRSRRQLGLVRWLRSSARPIMHGGLAVVMATALFTAERPIATSNLVAEVDAVSTYRSANAGWVTVVEMADPQPAYVPLRIIREKPRFIRLVPPTLQATEHLPDLNFLARV